MCLLWFRFYYGKVELRNIKWNADQTDPPAGGRGLKLFMIQEIRENQRCLHQRYQRSNP